MNCPNCGEKQWSITDQNYVKLFNTCWSEDKRKWEKGELTLEEFEAKEEKAAKEGSNGKAKPNA